MLRYPGILVAVVAGALILGVTAAAGGLFLSSAGSAALRHRIGDAFRWDAGLTVVAYGRLGGTPAGGSLSAEELFRRRDDFMRASADELSGLEPPVLTILGSEARLAAPSGEGPAAPVRLLTRTGYRSNIDAVEGSDADGVWVPESVAASIGVGPGDPVRVKVRDATVTVAVSGIYRDLAFLPPSEYWSPLAEVIYPGEGATPPPPLLADLELFMQMGAELGELDQFTWQLPLARGARSLVEAERLADALRAFGARFEDPDDTEIRTLFAGGTQGSELPELVSEAKSVVGGLSGPVGTLSLAGRAVALAVVGATGAFAVARRRTEMGLLSARGVSPAVLAARSALETLVPIAAGAALGFAAALWLIRVWGPGGPIDPSAVRSSLFGVGLMALVALVLLGLAAAVSGARESREEPGRVPAVLARAPWELVALGLAAASYYEIVTRGLVPLTAGAGAFRVDVLLLLFPILFIVGVSGLVARVFGWGLQRLRVTGGTWPASSFLAIRRLTAASPIALLLVAATAVGVGVLAYAGTVTASVRASTSVKALVSNGSDVRLIRPATGDVAFEPSVPFTVLERFERATMLPTREYVDVLAVDAATFPDAAFFDASFASRPLEAILADLAPGPGERFPVAVAGGVLPEGASLDLGPARLPLAAPVETLDAFPGMRSGRPLLIVDRATLESALAVFDTTLTGAGGTTELWARGDPGLVLAALAESGLRTEGAITVTEVQETLPFVALTWVFGLMLALGILAALVSLAGVLLYLQALQSAREVSYALSARMGLARRAHRLALGLELGGMLTVSFLVGVVVAIAAAGLVVPHIDLMPEVPPGPFLRLAPLLLLGTLAGLAAVGIAGAWGVQRAADRANVTEVLRVAG